MGNVGEREREYHKPLCYAMPPPQQKTPPPVLALNILLLSKFLRFWSNFKEHLNACHIIFEILTQFFYISSKIWPYDVRDFDPYFVLIKFEILTYIFDISTKRDILNKVFKNLTNIFEALINLLDIVTKCSTFWPKC